MNDSQTNQSEYSEEVKLALKMTEESRARMEKLTNELRRQLEAQARATIENGKNK
jgi:hypothetical protein